MPASPSASMMMSNFYLYSFFANDDDVAEKKRHGADEWMKICMCVFAMRPFYFMCVPLCMMIASRVMYYILYVYVAFGYVHLASYILHIQYLLLPTPSPFFSSLRRFYATFFFLRREQIFEYPL